MPNYAETSPEQYKGVSVSVSMRRGVSNSPETQYKYIMTFGNLTIEVSEETAVKMADDLLEKVQAANDPESAMHRRFNDAYDPETGCFHFS
jgi:hypothetical protein